MTHGDEGRQKSTLRGLNEIVLSMALQSKGPIWKGIASLHVTGWSLDEMLIAYQKSSQNRKATQNGGVFSLEMKRDFTIHWPPHNFEE